MAKPLVQFRSAAIRHKASTQATSAAGVSSAPAKRAMRRLLPSCRPILYRFPIAKDALQAGKHVICEKPLATSVAEARQLVATAREAKRRNATFHNLRYYPMVQQMRRMREDGDLGEILVVQGTYSQDWLLYDTDWNWRLESKANGPSRCLADIGSHWRDMPEHVTGQRIRSVSAE